MEKYLIKAMVQVGYNNYQSKIIEVFNKGDYVSVDEVYDRCAELRAQTGLNCYVELA